MANYANYKRITEENIDASVCGIVTCNHLAPGAGNGYGVIWIYNERGFCCRNCSNAGSCCQQANGKCCLWTVPASVSQVTFEIWYGGGGGAGHTCCTCCSFTIGGAGGNYATKTISTVPGCQYTVCAGGSWPCAKSHTCQASMGCRSYVSGYNLSNFCVTGGCGGCLYNGNAWGSRHHTSGCANCNICSSFGADFGISGTTGAKLGHGACHCYRTTSFTGQAPVIGLWQGTSASGAWCSCGCYVNWPAGGGMSGSSPYCGSWAKCCAGGSGQGGSGIVKITFL